VDMPFHRALAARDDVRVNIYDVENVMDWCAKFGCTTAQLRDAVTAVGTSAAALREYISSGRGNAQLGATERHHMAVSRPLRDSR
jgi:hypothetical protein